MRGDNFQFKWRPNKTLCETKLKQKEKKHEPLFAHTVLYAATV